MSGLSAQIFHEVTTVPEGSLRVQVPVAPSRSVTLQAARAVNVVTLAAERVTVVGESTQAALRVIVYVAFVPAYTHDGD